MFGLHLPKGVLYKNEVKKENNISMVEYSNYDDFIDDCDYFFNEYGDKTIEKLIYTYGDINDINSQYYEITKEEYFDRKENEEVF